MVSHYLPLHNQYTKPKTNNQEKFMTENNLLSLEKKFQNLQPLMEIIASDMKEAVEKNFDEEGRPNKWLDLTPQTKKQREIQGTWPGKILQRRGGGDGLLGSISTKATNSEAVVGTNKVYAAIHQFGGNIHQSGISKKGKSWVRNITMPARPFLVFTDDDVEDIKENIVSWLVS